MTVKTILLLNPVYVTFFWALVLSLNPGNNQKPKTFLGRFMFVAFVVYLSHFFYFMSIYSVYYYIDSLYTLASLLVYPFYHIYVRLLTIDRAFSFCSHGRFLAVPAIIFILHLTGYIIMDKDQALFYLHEGFPKYPEGKGITVYMHFVTQLFRLTFVVQVFLYLYLSFRLLIDHKSRIVDFYSNLEGQTLRWVQFFNLSLAVTSIASVIVAVMGREIFAVSEAALAFPSIVFSVMLFAIGVLGNEQREVTLQHDLRERDQTYQGDPKKIAGPDLNNVHDDKTGNPTGEKNKSFENDTKTDDILQQRIDLLFEKEMVFRRPDLKIWDLGTMLGTNRTYISRIINSRYGKNFCNHVNYYRVEYAKKLIRANPTLTNLEISEQSGFGSVNSFYRAFLSIENISLSDYRIKVSSEHTGK